MSGLPQKPLPGPGGADEALPDDLPGLESLLGALEREEREWSAYIKALSALEDPAAGVDYAAPLHEARQYRMLIRYRKDFCLARIRRLAN